jgi:proliferating cell nuclear antigen PCNA
MKLSYPSAKGFAKSMEVLWKIVDEGTFKVTKEGLKFLAMDPSQISMIVFHMPKELFSEYEVNEEIKNVGIDFNYTKAILKTAKQNEAITLEEKENKLVIKFKGEKSKRQFTVPLLDLGEGPTREPSIEYNNYIVIKANALADVINDAALTSNYAKLIITEEGFEMIAKSETGDSNVFLEKGNELIEVKAETGAKALYPVKYLEDILSSLPKDNEIKLSIETDKPLKLETTVEGAKIRYYLAPASES